MRPRFAIALLLATPLIAVAEKITLKTFTYKAPLQADVYTLHGRSNQPVVVFIHGGALMMGSRALSTNSGSLLHALVTAGYAVVSIDYRLAPQVKLPAIIEDLQDACKWVRQDGPRMEQPQVEFSLCNRRCQSPVRISHQPISDSISCSCYRPQ